MMKSPSTFSIPVWLSPSIQRPVKKTCLKSQAWDGRWYPVCHHVAKLFTEPTPTLVDQLGSFCQVNLLVQVPILLYTFRVELLSVFILTRQVINVFIRVIISSIGFLLKKHMNKESMYYELGTKLLYVAQSCIGSLFL